MSAKRLPCESQLRQLSNVVDAKYYLRELFNRSDVVLTEFESWLINKQIHDAFTILNRLHHVLECKFRPAMRSTMSLSDKEESDEITGHRSNSPVPVVATALPSVVITGEVLEAISITSERVKVE